RTDTKGIVVRGAYAPVRNFNIQATYFMNTLNKDETRDATFAVDDSLDYDRLQIDLNYKF
ncbi:MAG: hypothetical protein WBM03_11225, partial [Steroidobacteraceae bacterium]